MEIKTAFSSKKKCFLCRGRQSNIKLRQIKEYCVKKAFREFNIVIRQTARCCSRHLDENGFLTETSYCDIPTQFKKYHLAEIRILKSLSREELLFDRFKDFDSLSESDCFNITGWTKNQFKLFASYITSVKQSKKRNKLQLIAIYLYWLRRGDKQSTLAYMKERSIQRDISRYLSQIRSAIYNDFVPYYLGAQSRSREQFLTHNDIATKILYLDENNDETLCVFADGTYCRCEKSSNNSFQYDSWSGQKKDSLIKPFIICLCDGYIIDCYGPFKAHWNDAKIMEYILENDIELRKILLPKKTLVIADRGFRDILEKMLNKYQYTTKIPSCRNVKAEKLEKYGQLTALENTESRLVSKVRWIVEKSMPKLNASLENIRNTIIGHIAFDYKIACAIHNFNLTHSKVNEEQKLKKLTKKRLIAKRIDRKVKQNQQENKLKFMLTKHIKKSNSVIKIKIREFNKNSDFCVVLTKKKMREKLFYGSFHLKMSFSYLRDLINNGVFYIWNEKELAAYKKKKLISFDSQILGAEIKSRHIRGITGTSYKVFIEYTPNYNNYRAIKGNKILFFF